MDSLLVIRQLELDGGVPWKLGLPSFIVLACTPNKLYKKWIHTVDVTQVTQIYI